MLRRIPIKRVQCGLVAGVLGPDGGAGIEVRCRMGAARSAGSCLPLWVARLLAPAVAAATPPADCRARERAPARSRAAPRASASGQQAGSRLADQRVVLPYPA